MGWIGDDVLHSLYRIADLCVVPSIYEPFGLVALEAMASGCPCIVADTGGLREVVPNADVGLRFRSRNPRALATMMQRVLDDDALRERLVAEASVHVLRFDWNDVARADGGGLRGARRRGGAPTRARPAAGLVGSGGRACAPSDRASLSSSDFSPRPETIATTTQIVAIAGMRTTNVKSRPMLSVQAWLRAMSGANSMCGENTWPRQHAGSATSLGGANAQDHLRDDGARARAGRLRARAGRDDHRVASTPNAPAVGSMLHVGVDGAAPELAGALPESLTLHLQRGFALDLAAVAARCDASHARHRRLPARTAASAAGARRRARAALLNADDPGDDRDLPRRSDAARATWRAWCCGSTSAASRAPCARDCSPCRAGRSATSCVRRASPPRSRRSPASSSTLRCLSARHRRAPQRSRRPSIKRVRVTRNGKRVTVRRKVEAQGAPRPRRATRRRAPAAGPPA